MCILVVITNKAAHVSKKAKKKTKKLKENNFVLFKLNEILINF